MKDFYYSYINSMGVCGGNERSTAHPNIAASGLTVIFIIAILEPNTFVTASIVLLASSVGHVLCVCGYPQIIPSVIKGVPIPVVNVWRPFSRRVKPRQPMGEEFFALYGYNAVRILSDDSCRDAYWMPSRRRIYQPPKKSSLGIIAHKLAQLILRKVGLLDKHGMGRPSAHTRLAIKSPSGGDALGGFAFDTPQLVINQG